VIDRETETGTVHGAIKKVPLIFGGVVFSKSSPVWEIVSKPYFNLNFKP
jgi:hypothetical protein